MNAHKARSVDNLKSDFLHLEREIEVRTLLANEWRLWQQLKANLYKEQRNVTKDLKQKSRVKWAIEGEENSKYFYAIVRGRKTKNSLKGLLINGI